MFYQNARSIRGKSDIFSVNVLSAGYKIICITETWLDESIMSSEYFPPNFSVLRADRNFVATGKSRGGGSLIALRDEFIVSTLDLSMFKSVDIIDIIGCKVLLHSENVLLFAVYIPPYVSFEQLQLFINILEENFVNNCKIIIVGDFNVPNICNNLNDTKSIALKNFFSLCEFVQSNDYLNCNKGLLDLIIHNVASCRISISDFPLVQVDKELNSQFVKKFPLSQINAPFNFRKADYFNLYNQIGFTDWSFLHNMDDVNVLVDKL